MYMYIHVNGNSSHFLLYIHVCTCIITILTWIRAPSQIEIEVSRMTIITCMYNYTCTYKFFLSSGSAIAPLLDSAPVDVRRLYSGSVQEKLLSLKSLAPLLKMGEWIYVIINPWHACAVRGYGSCLVV